MNPDLSQHVFTVVFIQRPVLGGSGCHFFLACQFGNKPIAGFTAVLGIFHDQIRLAAVVGVDLPIVVEINRIDSFDAFIQEILAVDAAGSIAHGLINVGILIFNQNHIDAAFCNLTGRGNTGVSRTDNQNGSFNGFRNFALCDRRHRNAP